MTYNVLADTLAALRGAASPEDAGRIWNGTEQTDGLKLLIENMDIREPLTSERERKEAWEAVSCAMHEYIVGYPASSIRKVALWNICFHALSAMSEEYGIDAKTDIRDYLPDQYQRMPEVELVKALHPRKGVSKAELAESLGMSERQIDAYRYNLSPDSSVPSGQKKPLRFGGQLMRVNIQEIRRPNKPRKKYFYTPNTLHPIALQMNMIQVITILRGLSESEYPAVGRTVALEIWAQLSDYAKDRIFSLFTKRNDKFVSYLQELDEQVNRERTALPTEDPVIFQTENELWEELSISPGERLMVAVKGGEKYTIWLKQKPGQIECYENVQIGFDDYSRSRDRYRAVFQDGAHADIVFSEQELEEIERYRE